MRAISKVFAGSVGAVAFAAACAAPAPPAPAGAAAPAATQPAPSSSSGAASPAPAAGRAVPGKAPYDAPPAAAHQIEITIRSRAARDILASLTRQRYDASDAKLLESLPAIRLAIADSGRGEDVFERDFAAAFDESTRTSVFDFKSIREARDRWQTLLDAVDPRASEIARLAAARAASLLPGDRPVAVRLEVYLSFGIAGLADHIVVRQADGREGMVLDLARALGESEGEPLDSRISRIARVIAGEAFRQAWAEYRNQSNVWQHPDPSLGELDVLLRAVALAGPVSLYTVDENFFPLSVWLKEPMRRAIEDLNRRADRFVEAEGNLERRMDLLTDVRRGDFGRRIAGQDGAYLVDGIIQHGGVDALRRSLQEGPRSFFLAYERASEADRGLPPLSKSIREQLSGAASKKAPKATPPPK
ncbi:MAG TPA: hypothetical protein VE007_10365 [Thermoanaerobaculia bacterium]|nr:hypothetical protein [Thermoanaerobaculia bacterium]